MGNSSKHQVKGANFRSRSLAEPSDFLDSEGSEYDDYVLKPAKVEDHVKAKEKKRQPQAVVVPADPGAQERIRKLGENSAPTLTTGSIPTTLDEVHMLFGIASVTFLRSIGGDTITVQDIGIDSSGRLFRAQTPRGRHLEPEYSAQYTEAVESHEKNAELAVIEKSLYEKMSAIVNLNARHKLFYGTVFVQPLRDCCEKILQDKALPSQAKKIKELCDQVLGKVESTAFQAILDARDQLERKPDMFGAREWLKLKRRMRTMDPCVIERPSILEEMDVMLENGKIGHLVELIDSSMAPFKAYRDKVQKIRDMVKMYLEAR